MDLCKFILLSLALVHFTSFSEAREFHVVDNKASWQIPSSPDTYEKWAEKNRFLIGDSIVFKYDKKLDSVVEVSGADYKTCSRSHPIKSYNDGNTKITLDKSGPVFLISGADGHCEKGQKVEMRVLSANHHPAAAPSPSVRNGSHHHAPAPAPAHHSGSEMLRAGVFVGAAMAIMFALV
ncbi:mavicyanin-like [Salvia hispanica]|uniref:mavicyanin-like n=1 Tax=Salvia hispanica TaxID=49212 RepID=UPI002009D110|nr:mavicyanin-like [Salvia hispanica]